MWLQLNGRQVIKVKIFDTAGQERMGTIVQSYFKPLDAVVLCADLTRQVSFDNTKYWYK